MSFLIRVPHPVSTAPSKTRKSSREQPVGVPRRFAVGTMMIFSTMYAALFVFLKLVQASPESFTMISLYFTAVAMAQAFLFRGARPRAASILGGGIATFALTIGFASWSSFLWQDFESFSRTIAIGLVLTPIGAAVGYFAGCAAAGVFCVLERLGNRKNAVVDKSSLQPPRGENEPLELRVWSFLAQLKWNRQAVQRRPIRTALILSALLALAAILVGIAIMGFPSTIALGTMLGVSILLGFAAVGLEFHRHPFHWLLPVVALLVALPPLLLMRHLIVAGERLSEHFDLTSAAILWIACGLLLGLAVGSIIGWLTWFAERRAEIAQRYNLRSWLGVCGVIAISALALTWWFVVRHALASPQHRALVRVVEANGYLEYGRSSWTDCVIPVGIQASGKEVTSEDLRNFACFVQLQGLHLVDTSVDDVGTSALANLPFLAFLSLGGSQISDPTLQGLQSMTIRWLNVSDTNVSDDGLATLPSRLPSLTTLYLARTGVTNDGLRSLAGLPALSLLDLSECKITDDGIQQLSKMPGLSNLYLAGTHVSDEGLAHLAALPLVGIDLSNTSITDCGLQHLGKLPQLSNVKLVNTAVTMEGMQHLTGVSRIDVTGTAITSEDASRFELSGNHPDCRLITDDD